MKRSPDFLFAFTLAVILAGVLLAFSNTGQAATGKTNNGSQPYSAIVKADTP